ncbi:MAG TPA: hypothetical protein VKB38_19850 [Terracidiphilus sp.]|nr:hypothetical protein [Terracidiphilus sp.]
MPTVATKRQYSLGIWSFALGYFLSYVPYSGLSKAATSGLLTGGRPIPVASIIPAASVSTAFTVLMFITVLRWWRYGRKRAVLGHNVLFPRRHAFISGIGFSMIIITTTLAYSFKGISIILALVLMRAGVLSMSPLIDWAYRRRIRWFSWAGLAISLIAVLISFANMNDYRLTWLALLNLGAYLAGHVLRIPSMTRLAKTGGRDVACNYFVEEQSVAMPAIVLIPAILAVVSHGDIANQLRFGFAHLFDPSFAIFGWAIGFFYAALGIFLSFLYLDRRENTFCMPLFACSSLLSGIVASYLLLWFAHGPIPSGAQLTSAFVIIIALLIMSPLHHLPLYLRQLREAISEERLRLVTLVDNSAVEQQVAPRQRAGCVITIDFNPIREILRKH